MNAEEIIRRLGLHPHPKEQGYFVEVYRAGGQISQNALPSGYDGPRCFGTSIYFLLKAGGFSEMHRLKSDEIYYYHMGSPAEVLLLYPNGKGEMFRLGSQISNGETLQIVIPAGTWQGMQTTGDYTLLGCGVHPGFEFSDYESGVRESLVEAYPAWAKRIQLLTHA